MFIVMIASECAPVAKVGGLGDVVFGLSRELELRGNAVEIILPNPPGRGRPSLFGDSGLAQAVDEAISTDDHSRMVARHGEDPGITETRVDGEPRLNLEMRFREPPETRQSGRQKEMRGWILHSGRADRPVRPR